MKRKALVLAADPAPFEGPRITLGEGRWKVEASGDFQEHALVEEVNGSGVPFRHLLSTDPLFIEGPCTVRAILMEGIQALDIRQVTVQVCQVG